MKSIRAVGLCAGLVLVLSGACEAPAPVPAAGLTLDDLGLLSESGASPAATEPAPAVYTVQKGDTLFAIGRRFGVNVDTIRRINTLTSNDIQPGMALQMREPSADAGLFDLFIAGLDVPGVPDAMDPAVPAMPVGGGIGVAGYQWPVSGTVAARYSPVQGMDGIEIRAPAGTRVAAAREGTVVFRSFVAGLGNVVVIEHPLKYLTLYGYLGSVTVNCRDHVTRGTVIGTVGRSGSAGEARLHFRVYINYGDTTDPMKLLQ